VLPQDNAMLDYRSTGRTLRERWLKRQQELQQALHATFKNLPPQHPEHDFIRALFQHARGNSEFLISYLRSDRPLSALDREHFAQVLEGVLDHKRQRGRPRKRDERSAAMAALVFYKMWKAGNKQAGVKDHGHSDEMKSEAVRFVLDELEPHSRPLVPDKVKSLMGRSAARRG
jgi:hypothetical protein